jgi:hypothetical protein
MQQSQVRVYKLLQCIGNNNSGIGGGGCGAPSTAKVGEEKLAEL